MTWGLNHLDLCQLLLLPCNYVMQYQSSVELKLMQQFVKNLRFTAQLFFNTCSLLMKSVNPTVWTVGYAIPFHNAALF